MPKKKSDELKNKLIMKVIDYFGTQQKTAKKLGVNQSYISACLYNRRKLSPCKCVLLEKLTKGKIKAHRFYPYLKSIK